MDDDRDADCEDEVERTYVIQHAIAYVATGIAFLCVDLIWLRLMADSFYKPLLGDKVSETFSLGPALAFYAIYILGIVVFAVSPALASGRWTTAAGMGLLLGLVAYATYDLTNQATLKNWPVAVTIVDLCWGTVSTAFAAAIGLVVTRLISRIFGI